MTQVISTVLACAILAKLIIVAVFASFHFETSFHSDPTDVLQERINYFVLYFFYEVSHPRKETSICWNSILFWFKWHIKNDHLPINCGPKRNETGRKGQGRRKMEEDQKEGKIPKLSWLIAQDWKQMHSRSDVIWVDLESPSGLRGRGMGRFEEEGDK